MYVDDIHKIKTSYREKVKLNKRLRGDFQTPIVWKSFTFNGGAELNVWGKREGLNRENVFEGIHILQVKTDSTRIYGPNGGDQEGDLIINHQAGDIDSLIIQGEVKGDLIIKSKKELKIEKVDLNVNASKDLKLIRVNSEDVRLCGEVQNFIAENCSLLPNVDFNMNVRKRIRWDN